MKEMKIGVLVACLASLMAVVADNPDVYASLPRMVVWSGAPSRIKTRVLAKDGEKEAVCRF
jgi:hypothetical protein